MHEYIAELDGPQSYRTVTGKMILCKGGGGGGKGGAGALVAVVSMAVMPFAAPAIATALETSVAVGGAIAGAGMGAIGAAVTGGDPLKGALMGGVGGAIGGAMGGDAMMSNYVPGDFGTTLSNNFNSLTGAFSGQTPLQQTVNGLNNPVVNPNYSSAVIDGATTNATGAFVPGMIDGNINTASTALDAVNGAPTELQRTIANASMPGGSFNNALGSESVGASPSEVPQSSASKQNAGLNTANAPAAKNGFFDTTLGKGAMQLGVQTGASYLMGVPDALKAQQKTAEEQLALQREAYDFNKGQQLTKNTVGGQLIQDANSYNPNDFGAKAAANAAITDSNSWDAYQKSLEAQGRDPNYINAEKNRFNTNAGLNQSTAYGTGWTAGLNAQTGTKTTGANLYQPISNPADMYSTAKQQGQSAVGYAGSLANTINQDFGISPDANTAAARAKAAKTDASGNTIPG